jgi:DNA-binding MarR family transcriptional regulator
MRDEPVSGSQLFALVLLDEREETTAADLARLMHLTPQALTTLLKPLRDHGLIAREPDEAHRRRLNMRLTDAGRGVIARARALTPEIEEAMLGHLSPRERETLHKLLERIVRPMD